MPYCGTRPADGMGFPFTYTRCAAICRVCTYRRTPAEDQPLIGGAVDEWEIGLHSEFLEKTPVMGPLPLPTEARMQPELSAIHRILLLTPAAEGHWSRELPRAGKGLLARRGGSEGQPGGGSMMRG